MQGHLRNAFRKGCDAHRRHRCKLSPDVLARYEATESSQHRDNASSKAMASADVTVVDTAFAWCSRAVAHAQLLPERQLHRAKPRQGSDQPVGDWRTPDPPHADSWAPPQGQPSQGARQIHLPSARPGRRRADPAITCHSIADPEERWCATTPRGPRRRSHLLSRSPAGPQRDQTGAQDEPARGNQIRPRHGQIRQGGGAGSSPVAEARRTRREDGETGEEREEETTDGARAGQLCGTAAGRRRRRPRQMVPFHQLNFTVLDVLTKIREEDVIGRGGSGRVYRIHLDCQKDEEHGGGDAAAASPYSTVAVKKIGNAGKPDASLVKEFEAEVTSLGSLRHSNIINLLCCISGEDTKLLVYEYMENGSLDRWLHRREHHHRADDYTPGSLDWPTRLSIAVDVARGLSYMHHDFTRPVIHRDVKCSNILLDCGFRAKIADFGLARILAKSGESEAASAVCGTFGYIAPEYVNRAKVSDKVDVYSFGVVLLELATGRGPQDGGAESGSCLAKWAAKRYRNGDPCADLVDGEIRDPTYLDDMVAVFELGVLCTGEDPYSRPPMSEVLHRLLQCDQSRYGMSGDDDDDEVAKDVCGVESLECVVEMSVLS